MDRIRLKYNVWYPVQKITLAKEDLLITFHANVFPKTIPKDAFAEIRVERKGRLVNKLIGYDTVIRIVDHSILLRKIVYSEAQVAQQTTTDADLEVIEAQQYITDADADSLTIQQDNTDMDIASIVSQQSATDMDVSQIEQGQVTTEMELELLLMGV